MQNLQLRLTSFFCKGQKQANFGQKVHFLAEIPLNFPQFVLFYNRNRLSFQEILTLPIEYPLYDQSEPGLGFDIPENMPSRRRLIVDRVHWRTDAETAGLNYGDEILTINGEKPMFPHYADIIAQLTSKSVLQLTVRRIGFEI